MYLGGLMAALPQAIPTIRGRLLLGWMPRQQATSFLLNDCVFDPPIQAAEAERLWEDYRARVEALPQRNYSQPSRLPLTPEEQRHARRFRDFLRTLGPTVVYDVIKIDLRQTVVHQLYVVTERADSYVNRVRSSTGWLQECLPTVARSPAQIRTTVNVSGMNSTAVVELPHAEFIFLPDQTVT